MPTRTRKKNRFHCRRLSRKQKRLRNKNARRRKP